MAEIQKSNVDMKRANRNRIYRYIYEQGKTSKQEIAYALSMSMPTVLSNTKELSENGLIAETGEFESTGGRKAKALSVVANKAFAVGLDITKNHVSLVLINLNGEIIKHVRKGLAFCNTDEYFKTLGKMVEQLIKSENTDKNMILGVGVSFAGILAKDGTTISFSHVLDVQNLPCEHLSRYVPYNCIFINDANAAGTAEFRRSQLNSALFLSLSNTVGGSVFLEGELYEGQNGRSGEFGHMCLVPYGKKCYCGKNGCFDSYCSALELEAVYNGKLELFFEKLKENDEIAKIRWNRYLDDLAVMLNSLRMAYDCPIIVGGYVGGYLEEYINELRQKASLLNTFEPSGQYILPCRYKKEASALGAALMHVDRYINAI